MEEQEEQGKEFFSTLSPWWTAFYVCEHADPLPPESRRQPEYTKQGILATLPLFSQMANNH